MPPYLIELITWHTVAMNGAVSANATWRFAMRASDGMENGTRYPVHGTTLPALSYASRGFVGTLAWTVRPAPASPASPAPEPPDIPDLKTIASVTAFRPDYRMSLLGIETLQGHRVFHLSLSPYGDGVKHNLRDLWSDVDTYDLWAARYLKRDQGYSCPPRVLGS